MLNVQSPILYAILDPGKTQMDSPHLPSESSLTDLETGSESGVLQPLSCNHTVSSIVPETPQANSFSSTLPPPDSLRESCLKITQIEQLRRITPSTIPHVGTPSAVGAIRKSSSSLQITTPAVSRGLSSLSRSSIRKGISVEPYMGNDVSLTMDKEFDEEEAQLGLELARARHIVCRLERELAEARCTESIALRSAYKHSVTPSTSTPHTTTRTTVLTKPAEMVTACIIVLLTSISLSSNRHPPHTPHHPALPAPLFLLRSPAPEHDVFFVDQLSTCIPLLRALTGKCLLFYCHFPDKLLAHGAFVEGALQERNKRSIAIRWNIWRR
ncbi:hypothetical protein EV363DRAFT_1586982 [Boletus edulis]|nr:hypothetical protein EV363DRAFT_1586982 [Boletus edulis]